MLSIVAADVWQWTPFVMLVFFAALQALPEYVYEAARIDGLTERQIFFRVTLPLLRPTILIVLIIRAVDALRSLELVFMMTKGGPAGDTEVLPWYLYTTGFLSLDLGYAAAMAVLMLALVTALSQLFVRRLESQETALGPSRESAIRLRLRERASRLALGRLVLYDISSLLSLPAFACFRVM